MATKIVIVGLEKSGKSTIANFLAKHESALSLDEYVPTEIVRIMSFSVPMRTGQLKVSLWDSNDTNEHLLPGFSRDCEGLIIVFDPSRPEESYTKYLNAFQHLDRKCVVVMVHKREEDTIQIMLPGELQRFQNLTTSLNNDEEKQNIHNLFMRLVQGVVES
ncbi:hypothetical protein PCE1_003418 [Barthelona sp. PCE]